MLKELLVVDEVLKVLDVVDRVLVVLAVELDEVVVE